MITKEHLAASLTHECDVVLHLFSKLPAGALDYQPSAGQRTTLALLRYLAVCGSAGIHCMVNNDWKAFGRFTERVKEMSAEEFPAAMELQKKEIQDFFASVSEETLRTQEASVPGRGPMTLGAAILNGPLKWLTAYKMQLFLYAKAAGATELKTSNAWRGTDPS